MKIEPQNNTDNSAAKPRSFLKNTMGVKKIMGNFWVEHYEDVVLGAIVFLIVGAAFGIGFIVGGRFYEQAAININCPESFWKQ
ncbi:MAG: hypothetical protein UX61_C0024G0009 [Parcubacteria group bacterium GW2011_GWA2_46_7]|nr:MAG: hypothetical protein UX15_C0044G0003 [Parcubacteria group bacterium GW2011_GWA1_45_7]KKU10722.1 MAG: hypothetical protein UX14_C0010G0005 [Parcubacteria group bacterium GW2011_GWF1_45_5]KKU43305.1 MAG: hypothetical protein UX61_C0024G0009 [Parcubacteria group bacterium GW2011_GWA2_46_7]KKU46943.1 MAG: hypothetical protein UX66_C0029G0010 [Parcubacteria group bacterium GW2011_GWF2_46_8]OHD12193.1 MAG: hypothetical protein A2Z96_03535 [Spirochaetes bacterium GWB1_48_6]